MQWAAVAAGRYLLVTASLLFLFSCAPSRLVKPLKKGDRAVNASFGGPLIRFAGVVIPIPFTSAGYAHGVGNRVSLYGNLHTTSLLFGNIQTDIGSVFLIHEKPGIWGVTASPAIQMAWSARSMSGFRLWPSADLNLFVHPQARSSFFYAGANAWMEPGARRAHDEPRPKMFVPNLHTGYMWIGTNWNHQLEARWLGVGIPNLPGVTGYVGVGGKGALGIFYGITRVF
jgi:hypothetical protein